MRRMQDSGRSSPGRLSLGVFLTLLSLSLLATSCVTGGYFIPPNAPPTNVPDISFLFGTPLPPTDAGPEEQAPQPTQFETQVVNQAGNDPVQLVPPTPTDPAINTAPILYYSQAADTLPVVAVRFGVQPEEITSPEPIPDGNLLPPNQLLIIPRRIMNTASSQRLLPDSDLVDSPSTIDFDVASFAKDAGGYLNTYSEWLQSTKTTPGPQVIERVALENSINPRLLLALLEYQSNWVYGQPLTQNQKDYPMGLIDPNVKGLYHQLVWTVNHLSVGYYNWREGRLIDLQFSDGISARLAPDMNAGSVALEYYFSKLYDSEHWLQALNTETGFPALYERMYGNPWVRAQSVEPLYPPGLVQPSLILPFEMDRLWAFTGGPHGAWEHEGSYAALDFAPASKSSGCNKSYAWVVSSASGLVVRSGNGMVVLDLDGDGHEQTGWVLIHLHVSDEGRAPVGTWVDKGDRLGHPSCEGGIATGTHVHIARKYNGEWIAADGPMPFVLSGWTAHAGDTAYEGTMTRGDRVLIACTCSSRDTYVIRTKDDPE